MAAEHQRGFTELLHDTEERAGDLGRSLGELSQYLLAVYDAENDGSRKSGRLSTMRFVALARDVSNQVIDILHQARRQTPDHLR